MLSPGRNLRTLSTRNTNDANIFYTKSRREEDVLTMVEVVECGLRLAHLKKQRITLRMQLRWQGPEGTSVQRKAYHEVEPHAGRIQPWTPNLLSTSR